MNPLLLPAKGESASGGQPATCNLQPLTVFPHAGLVLPNTKIVADRVMLLPTGTTVTSEMMSEIGELIKKGIRG